MWARIFTDEDGVRLRLILLDKGRNLRARREPRKYLLTGKELPFVSGEPA